MPSYELTPPEVPKSQSLGKVFSSADVIKIIENFKKLDKNGDGRITREELKECLPPAVNDQMVEDIMRKLGDFNGDNVLEFEEYLRMNEWKLKLGEKYYDLYRRFQEFDADNSGMVSIEELRRLLDEKSFKCIVRSNKSRWFDCEEESIIAEVDTNQDGKLNYGEFLELAFNFNMRKKYEGRRE